MTEKKLISQRWDENFHQSIKNLSDQLNMSITDLTIEGLQIMMELSNNRELFLLSSEDRIKTVINALNIEDSSSPIAKRSRDTYPGFILNRISNYLKKNNGVMIATTQIAEDLDIPQSSVRRTVQDLSEDPEFTVIAGRPNFIGFQVR